MNWKNYYKIPVFIFIFFFQISAQDCDICLNDLDQATSITLPCRHSFCQNCLDSWIISYYNSTCPYCRFNIGNKDDYNLYKKFLNSIKNKNVCESINYANNLYEQHVIMSWLENLHLSVSELEERKKDTESWKIYLKANIKLFFNTKYQSLGSIFINKKLAIKRLKLLKEIYLELKETHFMKCNDIRSLIGSLLKKCINQLYNKQILVDSIDFFKSNKAYSNIIIRQYLEVYG